MASTRLTRQQIARIVNGDPEAIRTFEALESAVAETLPATAVTAADAALDAAVAQAAVNIATAKIAEMEGLLAALAMRPAAPGTEDFARLAETVEGLAVQPSPAGGATGTFATSDPFTVTVVDGRITSIA